jgi:hypothetical protein
MIADTPGNNGPMIGNLAFRGSGLAHHLALAT